jgi:acyl carrier protein
MVPAYFIFASALPAHPSGKLDRIALAEQATRTLQPQAGASPARSKRHESEVASAVREAWTSVLGLEREPDPDRNFFDAGGDSLRLLRLHSELQKRLQVKLDLVDFFQHTTIRTLSIFLEESGR